MKVVSSRYVSCGGRWLVKEAQVDGGFPGQELKNLVLNKTTSELFRLSVNKVMKARWLTTLNLGEIIYL